MSSDHELIWYCTEKIKNGWPPFKHGLIWCCGDNNKQLWPDMVLWEQKMMNKYDPKKHAFQCI